MKMYMHQFMEDEKSKLKGYKVDGEIRKVEPPKIDSRPVPPPKVNPAIIASNPFPKNKLQQPATGVFNTLPRVMKK